MIYHPRTLGVSVAYFFWSVISSIFILIGIYFVIDIFNKETFIHARTSLFVHDDVESPFVFIDTKYYYTLLIIIGLMIKIGLSPFHHLSIDLNDKLPLNMVAYIQTIYKGFLIVFTRSKWWYTNSLNNKIIFCSRVFINRYWRVWLLR